MLEFKKMIIDTDYFLEAMSANKFVNFVLTAKKVKETSKEELMNTEKLIQKYDGETAKKCFIKH